MNKPLVRVEEAAELLAVSRWTIYRWVEQGRLEGSKIGRGSLRVFTRSIERLVEQNRIDDFQPGVLSSERNSRSGASAGHAVAAH
ncbi:helix-turn-helix domain-containing protein [Nitrospira sp. NS4]|uniref:helix-turn-helix domain-containing protein n=1 Tax=Nitrospira sp. NS4 TaxID=3414498 RepID=UPI003C2E8AE8